MNLLTLIKLLEIQPPDNIITFDFCRASPRSFASSRGSYDELAIDFDFSFNITVLELLVKAKLALGNTFQGWKGGDYTMDGNTKVWVDHMGEWTNTKIIGINDLGYGYTIISTVNNEI